jgi:hypothetical protein
LSLVCRVLEAYRKMRDPEIIEVSAGGSPDEVLQRVSDVLRGKNIEV